ncbi:hypothetical protein N9L68_03535 [bacterium]|nr:hypothetical protein [bacterium]
MASRVGDVERFLHSCAHVAEYGRADAVWRGVRFCGVVGCGRVQACGVRHVMCGQ